MIVAGAGTDTLYGGGGSDSFIFDKSVWDEVFAPPVAATGLEYADIVEDFVTGPGGDILNIDILLELAGYSGSNPSLDVMLASTTTAAAMLSSRSILMAVAPLPPSHWPCLKMSTPPRSASMIT
jgi:Ca2+-binding RTX toxin-like protein